MWYQCPASHSAHHLLSCPSSSVAERAHQRVTLPFPQHDVAAKQKPTRLTSRSFCPQGHVTSSAMMWEQKWNVSLPGQSSYETEKSSLPSLPPPSGWMRHLGHAGSYLPKEAQLHGAEPRALPASGSPTEQLLAQRAASYHSALSSNITPSERPLPTTLK